MRRPGYSEISVFILWSLFLLTACRKSNPVEEAFNRPVDFTLQDTTGNEFRLSSTSGEVVLLNFFTTWCSTCQIEVIHLTALHEIYKDDGLIVLGIAMGVEDIDEVVAFKEEDTIPYLLLLDDGIVGGVEYGVQRVPTNYLIDRNERLFGPYSALSKEALSALIEPML